MHIARVVRWLVPSIAAVALVGCSSYATPGPGVRPAQLAAADEDVAARFERKPAAEFPARIAMARIQGAGYRSYSANSYGHGTYSVVTVRDVETERDLQRLSSMPLVAAAAPLGRMLLPEQLNSAKELRLAAAELHADVLLVYSFDTSFQIGGVSLSPLAVITLGVLPTKDAIVSSTASAAIFDVRTGFVYGVAECTATEKQIASSWTTCEATDSARRKAERKAFEQLLGEVERTWRQVIN